MLLDAETKARNSRRRNRSPLSMAIAQKKEKRKRKLIASLSTWPVRTVSVLQAFARG